MKNNQDVSKREKSAAVGLVVCFVAMIAIAGMLTFSQYERKTQEQQLAEAELEKDITKDNHLEKEQEPTQITNTESVQAQIGDMIEEDAPEIFEPEVEIIPAPVVEKQTLSFGSEDTLVWPVDGNVLLSYNMDQTVYFATLDQYKYNPALIIGGEVGQDVLSAAEGKVTSIDSDIQTGITLTMDIGSGYSVVYGQLKDVCVEEGSYVSQKDVIGYLDKPTKYYSVEGPNLYFQVLKDGESVNPMEFLEA